MISNTTAIVVAIFFFHGALASFIAGFKFYDKKDHTIKFFGLALVFIGLAFVSWGILAATHLNSLRVAAALAAVFLILGLFSFLVAGIQHLHDSASYATALYLGALGALGLFVLRTFIYPAHLLVTPQGFLVFDLNTAVKAAYILVLSVCILPAAGAVAGKFKTGNLKPLIKACFTALTIGGIVLVVSTDTALLTLDGIALSVAFLILWVTLVFGEQKALESVA